MVNNIYTLNETKEIISQLEALNVDVPLTYKVINDLNLNFKLFLELIEEDFQYIEGLYDEAVSDLAETE